MTNLRDHVKAWLESIGADGLMVPDKSIELIKADLPQNSWFYLVPAYRHADGTYHVTPVELIETRDAAQRQAGREEERRNGDCPCDPLACARKYDELAKRYAALVEAAREGLALQKKNYGYATDLHLDMIDWAKEISKALSDLDEARKG